MMRSPSPRLRLCLAILLLSPSFASVQAAAQVVNAAAVSGASAVSSVAGAAVRAPLALGAMPIQAPSLSINFAPTPTIIPALTPSAMNALPAASQAAPAIQAAAAAVAPAKAPSVHETVVPAKAPSVREAVVPAEAPSVRGAGAAALTGVFRADSKTSAAPAAAAAETRMNFMFDGEETRREIDGSATVAAGLPSLSAASTLEKSVPAASTAVKAAVPAARVAKAGRSFAVKALIAAALLLATPGIALAAGTAGPIVATAATSLAFLASIQPIAAAVGAVAGAIYGMFAARPKDGSSASSGEVFASILRYGVMGGAGAYILLDLTNIAFAGPSAIGLQPLTSAIAIAALGRTAFQDKFTDPATTGADRVMGAFPAVAAAVGISVGIAMGALVAPVLAVTLATTAMAVTGVATALYAAIFKPGQSLANGPARMAKGYVLQALMMGLALAVRSNPYLFWPFALLGASGFGLVLWTTALEIWAHRPGAPAQPLPPAPPVKPVPPVTPAPPTKGPGI